MGKVTQSHCFGYTSYFSQSPAQREEGHVRAGSTKTRRMSSF